MSREIASMSEQVATDDNRGRLTVQMMLSLSEQLALLFGMFEPGA